MVVLGVLAFCAGFGGGGKLVAIPALVLLVAGFIVFLIGRFR
jgi:hypothetical protein